MPRQVMASAKELKDTLVKAIPGANNVRLSMERRRGRMPCHS
jgi:hypothetical protein